MCLAQHLAHSKCPVIVAGTSPESCTVKGKSREASR